MITNIKKRLKEQFFPIIEYITNYKHEKKDFFQNHGYELNLKNPRSFNEKIVWKKLYDRNPLLPVVADKYRCRFYVEEILGKEQAQEILIPLFCVTHEPETIPFDSFREPYIIKPNNASGRHIFVKDIKIVNRQEVIKKCIEWLSKSYGTSGHEWAYKIIKRKIIVEKLLSDENGELPLDYKFYVFHGKCKMIQVNFNRHTDLQETLFNEKWERLDINYGVKPGPVIQKPDNIDRMLSIAEALGNEFDFIRVDLYSINDKIYFNEFTNYPAAGRVKIIPEQFDFELGKYWNIEPDYWKGYTN